MTEGAISRSVMQMRLEAWQLADGLFSPHYESDQYTSTELRRIADELDRRAKAPGKIPRGRPGEP